MWPEELLPISPLNLSFFFPILYRYTFSFNYPNIIRKFSRVSSFSHEPTDPIQANMTPGTRSSSSINQPKGSGPRWPRKSYFFFFPLPTTFFLFLILDFFKFFFYNFLYKSNTCFLIFNSLMILKIHWNSF